MKKNLMFLFFLSILFTIVGFGFAHAYSDESSSYTSSSYSDSYVYTQFDSDLTINHNVVLGGYSVSSTGYSKTAWLGFTPYNADSIDHRDVFTWSKFGFSGLSISWPPGVDATKSSSSLTINLHADDTWYIRHDYTNIKASVPMGNSITHYYQTALSTYKFGSNFKTVSTSDDIVIW